MRYPTLDLPVSRHRLAVLLSTATLLLATCGGAPDDPMETSDKQPSGNGVELLFVHAITLGLERVVMDEIVADFNASHDGITVIQERMASDTYEDLGQVKYLDSGNPPDLYFEWGGWRVQRCVAKEWALNLTPYMEDGWKERFYDVCWDYANVDGQTYLSPNGIDVTTLIWYNKDLFETLGLEEPKDWPEFVEQGRKANEAGLIPVGAGNDELWVMGNWAAHLTSRIVGEQHYADVLSLKEGTSLTDPGFVRALEMLGELQALGFYNADINSLASEQGEVLFRQAKSLFYPIGIWVIDDWALSAPDLNYSFINTPPIPGGVGNQKSVLGLVSGFMAHRRTRHPDEAVAFLKFLSSAESQRRLVNIGHSSATKEAYNEAEINPHLAKVVETLATGGKLVPPADTGFRLKVAEEFYRAVARVVAGHVTPEEALKRAEQGVARLRP